MKEYVKKEEKSTEKFAESLDELACEGARRMLMDALEYEVEEFLGRKRYERSEEFTGYRNGYGKKRQVAMGSGTVEVRAPRVRDNEEAFDSLVLKRYQRQLLNFMKDLLK